MILTKPLTNIEIIELLVDHSNIKTLEHLLDKELENYKRLKHLKIARKKISIERARNLFFELKSSVDNFLGIKNSSIPQILFSSYFIDDNLTHYDSVTEAIVLVKGCEGIILGSLAHEYTHHIQNVKGILKHDFGAFNEGQCRSVERFVGENVNNQITLQDICFRNFTELKSVYFWVCNSFVEKLNSHYFNFRTPKDDLEKKYLEENEIPSVHALGNACFMLAELEQGNRIYAETLKANRALPDKDKSSSKV